MTEWHDISTAPDSEVMWLGTESDPGADVHMFFVGIGYAVEDRIMELPKHERIYPSHWAKITSPVPGARVAFYNRGEYAVNALEKET